MNKAKPGAAAKHPEHRLRALYAGRDFLVNVKYVGMIDKTVIVFREPAANEARAWPVEQFDDTGVRFTSTHFAAQEYESVALAIANQMVERMPVCGNSRTLELATNTDGRVRTMYRDERRAWVVFARCLNTI